MTHHSKTFGKVILLAALILVGCGERHPLTDLIPGDALGVLEARNIDSLFKGIEPFAPWITGTPSTDKNNTARNLADRLLNELGIKMEWINQKLPLAMALVPEKGSILKTGSPFAQWYFLPMEKGLEDFKKLQEKLPTGTKSVFERGYGVLVIDSQKSPVYPLPRTLDTSELKLSDQGILKAYFSLTQTATALGSPFTMAKSLFKAGIQQVLNVDPYSAQALKTWTGKTLEALVDGLFEIDTVSGELSTQGNLHFYQFKINFQKDGPTHRYLKKVKPSPGTLDYTKHLDSRALVAGILNIDPKTFSQETQEFFKALHENVEPGMKRKLDSIGTDFEKSMGGRSAFSFSFGPSWDKVLTGMKTGNYTQDEFDEIVKHLPLSLSYTQELREKVPFQNATRNLLADDFFNVYLPYIYGFTALPMDMNTTFKEDTLGIAFKVPEVSLELLGDQAQTMESIRTSVQFLNQILKVHLDFQDTVFKASFSTEANNLTLPLDPKKFANLIPEDSQFVLFSSPFVKSNTPETCFYLKLNEGNVSLGLGIDTEALKKGITHDADF